jgi:hypothetical protein
LAIGPLIGGRWSTAVILNRPFVGHAAHAPQFACAQLHSHRLFHEFSVSRRVGYPARPLVRVHLMAATALANRIAGWRRPFSQQQGEGAMPDIPGAQRIDGL